MERHPQVKRRTEEHFYKVKTVNEPKKTPKSILRVRSKCLYAQKSEVPRRNNK